mgnify:CR=1 FL=1
MLEKQERQDIKRIAEIMSLKMEMPGYKIEYLLMDAIEQVLGIVDSNDPINYLDDGYCTEQDVSGTWCVLDSHSQVIYSKWDTEAEALRDAMKRNIASQ